MDRDALNVMNKLREAGHTAYLVGGGVRDLLVQIPPKDFDISTSAKPEEIRSLFRNSILIGRRFRLAHIRFGKKILEVSTFRSGETGNQLIIHDNEWGSPEQDVLRRDFTINGLFYDPVKNEVIDYVGGCLDIEKKLLRTIGNPIDRFTQDPVRMIRLLKFRARFNFKVEQKTLHALETCQEEILKSSPARILEETFKMMESGASENFFRLMVESGLMAHLYPALDNFLKNKYAEDIYKHLRVADEIFHLSNNNQSLERPVLTSCLIFPILEREIECQYLEKGIKPTLGEIFSLSHALIRGFISTSFPQFPRRLRATMNFILDTQFRFTPSSLKKIGRERSFFHEDFPATLKFLELRSLVNKDLEEIYHHWKQRFLNHRKKYKSTEKKRSYRRHPPRRGNP